MSPVPPTPCIAVVEDDDEMRALLASTLLREGYALRSYRNGLEFLERVIAGPIPIRIDLLICDLRMPGVTGLSLLEGLRELSETRRLHVILITAFGNAEIHARAAQFGAVAVLDKPFEMAALLTAVAAALQPRRDSSAQSDTESVRARR